MRKEDILIIKDPDVAKLFADDTRRQILQNLRHHELSTTDLAKLLNKSHSSIMHHLKLLQEAGLVEMTKMERKRNLVQAYYVSTAQRFIISYSLSESLNVPEILTWQNEMLNKIIEGLNAFGIDVPEDEKDKISELIGVCCLREQRAFEEAIEQQVESIKFEKPVYAAIIRLLTQIKLSQNRGHVNMIEELGKLLKPRTKMEVSD